MLPSLNDDQIDEGNAMPKPRTLSEDDLKTLAFVCHEEIQWPAPEEGGYATATCNGHPYQARVAPQKSDPEETP